MGYPVRRADLRLTCCGVARSCYATVLMHAVAGGPQPSHWGVAFVQLRRPRAPLYSPDACGGGALPRGPGRYVPAAAPLTEMLHTTCYTLCDLTQVRVGGEPSASAPNAYRWVIASERHGA